MRYYSGIGSRNTPKEICSEMTKLASILEQCGFILRSGNADGADQAFAEGVQKQAQIWLPWSSFNSDFREDFPQHDYRVISLSDEAAWLSVSEFHPNAKNLSETSCKFMARNYRQVIGLNEPNSEFVVCWTEDGLPRGGTAQALRIARARNIRVLNMYDFPTVKSIVDQLTIYGEI